MNQLNPNPLSPEDATQQRVATLMAKYGDLNDLALLEAVLRDDLTGPIALVSSFGTESAVLLHMVSQIDPGFPVLLLNTGKLFGETLRYRNQLADMLGLTNIQEVRPQANDLAEHDPKSLLFTTDPDKCCDIRKTQPMNAALSEYDGWITGRKRFQTSERKSMDVIEVNGTQMKINPLATWTPEDITAYFDTHKLPQHPLQKDGYLSIGCFTCTDRVAAGEDPRSGRWRGQNKSECGIHLKSPKYDPVI